MKRYLLFDSGCSLCTQLARDIEFESDGWLEAKSLRDPEILALVKTARPDWQWQPTLLEIEEDVVTVSTGIQLKARIVKGVGIRRAWRIAELITKATPNPGHTLYQERRNFLRQSSALLVTIPLLRSPALVRTLFSTGPGGMAYQDYRDSDFGFTLQYPTSWKIDVKHRQLYPWKDDEAILKRVIFSGTPALVLCNKRSLAFSSGANATHSKS